MEMYLILKLSCQCMWLKLKLANFKQLIQNITPLHYQYNNNAAIKAKAVTETFT